MMEIGVVILSYKNIEDTIECIESFKGIKSDIYELKLILVDNSETDYYINEILKKVEVDKYFTTDNNGYSHGNNIGIRYAIEINCDYICVINNDTIVEADFIDNILDFYFKNENKEKLGIIAPKILRYYDKKIWSSGGYFSKILFKYRTKNNEISKPQKSCFINGCCIVVKTSVFKDIGFFNEKYFMYSEDSDFCYNLHKNKYKNFVIPSSIIYHKVSVSSGVGSPFQLYYLYRNKMIFIKNNFKGIKKYYGLMANYFQARYRMFIFLLKRKKDSRIAIKYALKDYSKFEGRYRY